MLIPIKLLNNLSNEQYSEVIEAKIGETICPRGIIVDEKKLKPELLEQIKRLK